MLETYTSQWINPIIVYLSDGAPTVHENCGPSDPGSCPYSNALTDISTMKTTKKTPFCPTCQSYAVSVQNNVYGDAIMTQLADPGRFYSITTEPGIITAGTTISCG
jgi:hypothetical protein